MDWHNRWFQYVVLLFLALIWGSSFILMKIGLKSFSSTQAACIRIFLASLVLLPYSLRCLKGLQKKDLKYLLIAGFFGSLIPAFLFMKAETRIDSALAGMLNSLTPVFTLIIGLLFLSIKTKWFQVVGLFLGFAGALGLVSSGIDISLKNINGYAFFIVLATICYAININTVKTYLTHLRGVQITSLSFFFIGPFALIIFLTTDLKPIFQSTEWGIHFAALAFLGIVCTALAMLIMNSLIRYTSAVFASSVTYIIPIFAIFWGLLDNEMVTWLHVSFMVVVLTGVYLINRKT
jgi:drug/metabolite transporter (DMT)-like permease